jgi:hypothetical protein
VVGGKSSGHPRAIYSDIQITGGCNLHFGDAFDSTDTGADGLGNLERSGAQRLGKGKDGDCEITKLNFRRLFDYEIRQSRARVTVAQKLHDALSEAMFEMTIQSFL